MIFFGAEGIVESLDDIRAPAGDIAWIWIGLFIEDI